MGGSNGGMGGGRFGPLGCCGDDGCVRGIGGRLTNGGFPLPFRGPAVGGVSAGQSAPGEGFLLGGMMGGTMGTRGTLGSMPPHAQGTLAQPFKLE
jgi:hypothetical protein